MTARDSSHGLARFGAVVSPMQSTALALAEVLDQMSIVEHHNTNIPLLIMPRVANESEIRSFHAALDAALKQHPHSIRIDCSWLERLSQNHIRLLVAVREGCRSGNLQATLTDLPLTAQRTLQVLQLAEWFILDPTTSPSHVGHTSLATIDWLQTHRQRFPVTPEAARHALRRLQAFLETAGIPYATSLDVHIVAYELLQNIIDHAHARPSDDIELQIECDRTSIRMVISDTGEAFNPAQRMAEISTPRTLDTQEPQGIGLLLVRKLTDRIDCRRRAGRNVTTVQFRIVEGGTRFRRSTQAPHRRTIPSARVPSR